ncbi:MAG TPA: DUF1287 domain-containing protein [Pyrinomonadaceae bacterium]|nr:DUF1287 domain-containing protein [Pyrinomonadaceae bacterium]
MKALVLTVFVAAASLCIACSGTSLTSPPSAPFISGGSIEKKEVASEPIGKLLQSAEEQTRLTKNYTQAYFTIPYPNGDLPIETGACSDVVIRSFRAAGIDLQKEVHEDLAANFAAYPKKWGLAAPDSNIDHRRVPNLQTFFTRKGKSVGITANGDDYLPGDVVSWDLDGKGMTHIGIVSNMWNEKTKRYLIIHNIGGGTKAEDRLFDWKITGHFRYF